MALNPGRLRRPRPDAVASDGMGKVEEYRRALRELPAWEPFLLERSGLPGPRGNLELAAAVAEEAEEATLRR